MSSKSTLFNSRRTFNTSHGVVDYYAISVLEDAGLIEIAKTPYSIRVLLENTLRKADEGLATDEHVRLVSSWRPDAKMAK